MSKIEKLFDTSIFFKIEKTGMEPVGTGMVLYITILGPVMILVPIKKKDEKKGLTYDTLIYRHTHK